LEVTVARDGEVIFSGIGGHSNGDPLLPAIALANELRTGPGILPGQIVTTGTYSGLRYVPAGSTVTVSFKGFGQVEVAFER
jgi:2-keto-4-pentenoate hydratase